MMAEKLTTEDRAEINRLREYCEAMASCKCASTTQWEVDKRDAAFEIPSRDVGLEPKPCGGCYFCKAKAALANEADRRKGMEYTERDFFYRFGPNRRKEPYSTLEAAEMCREVLGRALHKNEPQRRTVTCGGLLKEKADA